MFISGLLENESVIHTSKRYYSSFKKKEILPFTITWLNLEDIILSEISQTQKDKYYIISVQSLSHVRLFVTQWTAAGQASLSITSSWSLLKLMSIQSVMPSNCLILCCPLLFPSSIFPSIRIFSNESVLCIRWSNYWSFSLSISPSNEYSGLISFRMDWLDLLAVQVTLKSLFQNHSSKASILFILSLLGLF